VDATFNIHSPLTALLCFGTTPKIDSSNYTINSIWMSEQQAAQMCNFSRKHQGKGITTQNTLIKWKSDIWTYTTRHVGRAG